MRGGGIAARRTKDKYIYIYIYKYILSGRKIQFFTGFHFIVVLPLVFRGWVRIEPVFSFLLGPVVLQFSCRGLSQWTHLCKKHWFDYGFLLFLYWVFLYDRFGSFPPIPLHRFFTVFCYRMGALHSPFVYQLFTGFPGNGLVNKKKKKR